MLYRSSIGAITLAGVLGLATAALAFDESKYPDFSGQWRRPPGVGIQWDPTKRFGLDQQPPLTPEYQAVWEASMADQAAGGQGNDAPSRCVPYGMPRIMTTVFPMEIVVTQNATHLLSEYTMPRRIYTDGREFPKEIEPSFNGYSIGKWVDENGDGRYDVLEIETRGLKGPRSYDASGLPFHQDNETVVKERVYRRQDQPGHPARRDHDLRSFPDATVDGHQELRPRPQSDLVPEPLLGRQPPRHHRQRGLCPELRRLSDAGQEGPEAAGPEIFQADQELTPSAAIDTSPRSRGDVP